MCGFLGCVVKYEKSTPVLESSLELIKHRGPDHSAFSCHKVGGKFLYLGHTRLSIIDLSDSASQPFESLCGRYEIIFNGEIYNYREIRCRLNKLGYEFKTQSDTEVLLYAFIEWGQKCLIDLIGMFSFVFYDKQKQNLTMVRDAFGIKPFFYSLKDGELYFSSELQALTNLCQEPVRPNLQRAYDYLVHGDYDSSCSTFVEGIKHLPPANIMTFDLNSGQASEPKAWWNPDILTNTEITFEYAVNKLRDLFLDSIGLHLRSDVPLGVALSGGIDSSAVVSAVRYLKRDLKLSTFSYIASDEKISEEAWVDALNEKMNAIPHKVLADEKEMKSDLDDMLLKQGEPFGTTSIYAQYRVFKLVKESGVTVTLDGQGADELLAGYSGYPGHRLLSIIETDGWVSANSYAKRWAKSAPGRSYALAWKHFLRIKFPDNVYKLVRKKVGRNFEPKWINTEYLKNQGVLFIERRPKLDPIYRGLRVKEALANALSNRGLPSLLRHGDRNSMAFSVESRVPFLTIPLAEFLLSLPEEYLVSDNGITKNIFREAMRGIVPDSHLDRKDKIGFKTPESTWLFSMIDEIKGWINESPELDFLDKKEVLHELEDIINGKKPFDGRVWRWVNYLRWCKLIGVK